MTRTLSRRAIGGALGVGLLSAACGGDGSARPALDLITPLATPLAAVPGFDEPGRWSGRTLRIGLWGGEIQQAIAAAVLDSFSVLTGAVVSIFRADYGRLTDSVAAGDGFLDLIVADFTRVGGLLAAGTVAAIPENLVDPTRLDPIPPMPGGVPLYAYAMVNAVRHDLAPDDDLPTTWPAWADTNRYPSPRSLPGSALGAIEVALLADGVARDERYPLDVERALGKLDALASSVGTHWWRSGDEAVIWLIQEEVSLAATWHHRVVAAQLDGRPIDVAWRDALVVADYLAIPAGSPNADVAADLIRFALTDEVQSVLAYASHLGPVVTGAFHHITPVGARRFPTNPDYVDDLMPMDPTWWSDNRGATEQRFAEWLASRGVVLP